MQKHCILCEIGISRRKMIASLMHEMFPISQEKVPLSSTISIVLAHPQDIDSRDISLLVELIISHLNLKISFPVLKR